MKCRFDDDRFSDDLDFSETERGTHSDFMERAIREACDVTERLPEIARDRRLVSFCRSFRRASFPGQDSRRFRGMILFRGDFK